MNFDLEINKKNQILLIFASFFSLLFLNQFNQHGDYNFYKQVFFDLKGTTLKEIWFPYFVETNRVFYYNAEPLFLTLLKLNSHFLKFEIFNSITLFVFIIVYLKFILSINKSTITIIFVLISSYYLWSLILASEKNKISLIFFFLSLIFRQRLLFFISFYYISILIHSSMVLYYLIILSFLLLYKTEMLKSYNYKKKIIIFIVLMIPIILQKGFILGKTIGYNEHEQRLINQYNEHEQRLINQNDRSYLEQNVKETFINEISFFDKIKFKKEIKLFYYSFKIRYNGIDVENRSFSLIFDSYTIIKLLFFYFFIYLFSKKIFQTFFSFFLVLIISSIIGLSRFPIILTILIVYLFLDNYQQQIYKKKYLFTYAIFLIFAVWKLNNLIIQIINYGQIY